MLWKKLRDLLSGEAFLPHEEDIGYPLLQRLRGRTVMVVQHKTNTVLCRVLKMTKEGEWVSLHRCEMPWVIEEVKSQWFALQSEYHLQYAVWVDDGEWEVQSSRVRWGKPTQELQSAMEREEVIPYDEREKGRLYSPVIVSDTGEMLLFSVREERVRTAVNALRDCGFWVLRSGIMAAMACRRLFSLQPIVKGHGYWVLVFEGSALLLYRKGSLVREVGQWCGDTTSEEWTETCVRWRERMQEADASVWLMSGDSVELKNIQETHNTQRMKIDWVEGRDPVVLWDSATGVQPELYKSNLEVRPCLDKRWKQIWRTVVALILGLLAWWGTEIWKGDQVRREKQVAEATIEGMEQRLAEMQQEKSLLDKTRSEARQMSVWVRSLIHTPRLAPFVASVVPMGVRIRDLTIRLFEGQRQVEIILDMEGARDGLDAVSPLLIRKLEESGYQMVSLDQPDIRDGMRFRGIFLYLPQF